MANDPTRSDDRQRPEVVGQPGLGQETRPLVQVGLALGQQATVAQSLAAKLTEEQVGKLVDQGLIATNNKHAQQMASIGTMKMLFCIIPIALVLIVFLFLHYQRPELLKDIIVLFLGASGGFGLGRVSAPKADASTTSPS